VHLTVIMRKICISLLQRIHNIGIKFNPTNSSFKSINEEVRKALNGENHENTNDLAVE